MLLIAGGDINNPADGHVLNIPARYVESPCWYEVLTSLVLRMICFTKTVTKTLQNHLLIKRISMIEAVTS